MVKFYKLSKNGKMLSRKDGDWVEKFYYDQLANRERQLRKELTLENIKYKLFDFLDAGNLSSSNKLATSIMTISFIAMLDNMIKEGNNYEKGVKPEPLSNLTKHENSPLSSSNMEKANIDNGEVK